MATLFDQIARGPRSYGSLGWNFGGRDTFGAGPGWCGRAGARDTVPCHYPCILLKAIYLTESSWRQFCDSGRTVVAFDCGYGIAQVTSGMRPGETSAFDPNRVASSPAYNVSVGAAILADKWRASACVGDNNPDVIEDWYFAVWGYNGFAFKNNPNNPMYRADRVEFRTPGNASAQVRGNYPYQELVWGYAHYPLTTTHYRGIGLSYPNRSEICSSCGFPMANISEPRPSHMDPCTGTAPPDAGVTDAGVTDAGPRDAGTPDVGMPDAGEPDAGAPDVVDVAVAPDAGPRDTGPRDVGTDVGAEGSGVRGGCGCAVPAGGRQGVRGLGALAAVAAALAARRRKR
jgi:MYXO-CTERM domain-containing protein